MLDAYARALKQLSIRARSRHELESFLTRAGYAKSEIDSALARVTELNYLDDEKFAHSRALALFREGRFGETAVVHRLKAHGLTDAQIRKAVKAAQVELSFDPLTAARQLLDKRGLGGALDDKQRAKAARLLASRGFAEDIIDRLLT